jgi:hypothetical protein
MGGLAMNRSEYIQDVLHFYEGHVLALETVSILLEDAMKWEREQCIEALRHEARINPFKYRAWPHEAADLLEE